MDLRPIVPLGRGRPCRAVGGTGSQGSAIWTSLSCVSGTLSMPTPVVVNNGQ